MTGIECLAAVLALFSLSLSPTDSGATLPPDTTGPPTVGWVAYGELLGAGYAYSLNVERGIGGPGWIGRLGVSALDAGDGIALLMPLTFSRWFRSSADAAAGFELGAGLVLTTGRVDFEEYDTGDGLSTIGTLLAGYRYQRPGGGMFWRLAVTPRITPGSIYPWFGLSLGWAWP